MSNIQYTDKTIADVPPGGKFHKVAKSEAAANRLPIEEAVADGGKRDGKTATSPNTVANTEK